MCSLFLSSAIPSIDIVLAKFFNLWKKKENWKIKWEEKKIKHGTSNKKMKKTYLDEDLKKLSKTQSWWKFVLIWWLNAAFAF